MHIKPETTWDNYWRQTGVAWGDIHKIVYQVVKRELPSKASRCLEVGSGTGLVAKVLADKHSRELFLLDSSFFTLTRSRTFEGFFINGSALHLPFMEGSFDFVWSSGLIEHFQEKDQEKIFREMQYVLKEGGKLVILAPNRKAILYERYRRKSMRNGTWPYGYEEPMKQSDLARLGPMTKCYTTGLWYQGHFLSAMFSRNLSSKANIIVRRILGNLYHLPSMTSMRGYLIVGVYSKQAGDWHSPL